MRKKSFIRNTTLTVMGQFFGLAATMIGGILTARFLGAEGKGQVTLAMSTGMLLARVLCIGSEESVPYFLAGRKMDVRMVLGNWLIILALAMVVTYAVIMPIAYSCLMDNLLDGVPFGLLLLGTLSCPIYLLRLMINGILAGYEDFSRQTLHNIVLSIASILAVLISLVMLRCSPLGYILFQHGFSVLSLVIGAGLLLQTIPFRPAFSMSALTQMLRYGSKSMLSQLLTLIDLRLDIYIVNLFLQTASVGVYTVAASIANMFWIIPNGIVISMFPRVASLSGDQSNRLTALLCRNAIWLTVLGGGSFMLVSKPIIVWVFGPDFAPAALALAFLMPGVLGQVVARICFTDCAARGYPGKATLSNAITASLTILLDFVLIPRMGIQGAALASSIAYCTGGLLGLYWHIRISGNSLPSLLWITKTDLAYYGKFVGRIIRLGKTGRESQEDLD
jgi:stage V sporulation protein B